MANPDEVRILAPRSFQAHLSRRSLITTGTAAAGAGLLLMGCGSSKKAADTTAGATETTAAQPADTGGKPLPQASGDWSRVINKSSGTLAMYTWGEYNDPALIGAQADAALGVKMTVDYYGSNEDLITKLEAAKGTTGFDIVVPTGPYVPQMIQKGLLMKFDKSKLPNIVNVDPLYLGRAWDPGNEYSVCKDWGSTGFLYDKTVIKKELKTWQDFLDACINEASGNCSLLDTPINILGAYFFANGIDWNTTKKEDLDAAEEYLVNKLAKHIKAFDSYPSTKLAEGAYALSMAWNGDARQAYSRIADAKGTPENWVWVLGAPDTELWMDNYTIATGAPNPDAAHAWINWLLTPEISIQDLNYHGYHSGMKNMEALIKELLPTMAKPDMVFFSDAQVKTMHTQEINASQDRQVDIYNKIKAAAGG